MKWQGWMVQWQEYGKWRFKFCSSHEEAVAECEKIGNRASMWEL